MMHVQALAEPTAAQNTQRLEPAWQARRMGVMNLFSGDLLRCCLAPVGQLLPAVSDVLLSHCDPVTPCQPNCQALLAQPPG